MLQHRCIRALQIVIIIIINPVSVMDYGGNRRSNYWSGYRAQSGPASERGDYGSLLNTTAKTNTARSIC